MTHAERHISNESHKDSVIGVRIDHHHDNRGNQVGCVYEFAYGIEDRISKSGLSDVRVPKNYIEGYNHPT